MADYTYYIFDRDGNRKNEVQADTHAYQGAILELYNLEYVGTFQQTHVEKLIVSYKEWGSFWRERNDES